MQTQLYINGAWVEPAKGGTLPVIDPATEQVFHHIPAATAEDAEAAVQAARAAFDHGPWPRLSGKERAVYLRAMAQGIRDRLPELAALEVRDNGKPLPEAEWDLGDAAGCFDFYADLAEELDGEEEQIALADGRFTAKAVREPLGVAVAIVPWNYPLLMASWKVVPALAARCTMVLKPAETTSLTALELGAAASWRRGRRISNGCRWSWAANRPSWSLPIATLKRPSNGSCSAFSGIRGRSVRPPAACWSSARFMRRCWRG